MEAGTLSPTRELSPAERLRAAANRRPALAAAAVLGLILVVLVASQGLHDVAQTGINGLSLGAIFALGVVGLRVGRTSLIVIVVGVITLIAIGLMLRYALLGKRMRALSDNLELAETSGIDTSRVILWTWIFAGALAGLAGVMAGAVTDVRPEMGFELLLPIFAAVVLGGIGDAFGALAAGLVLGVVIEWSTLLIDARWKIFIGFVVLIIALIIRPQGIFGRAK